jgi:histidine ammonia-lyase/phenylalanine ammonia-lyase
VVDEKFNNGLTPNLIPRLPPGHPEEGLNHGFKSDAARLLVACAEALSRCAAHRFSLHECHNQDKVSMGATAARQARDVVKLVEKVAAILLIALCQAADLRGPRRLGRTRAVYERVRSRVAALEIDRPMADDIAAVVEMAQDGVLTAGLEGES